MAQHFRIYFLKIKESLNLEGGALNEPKASGSRVLRVLVVRKLSYLGERSEPRENARASGERGAPRFRVSSRASTFHDIRKMDSLREHPVISARKYVCGLQATKWRAFSQAISVLSFLPKQEQDIINYLQRP